MNSTRISTKSQLTPNGDDALLHFRVSTGGTVAKFGTLVIIFGVLDFNAIDLISRVQTADGEASAIVSLPPNHA